MNIYIIVFAVYLVVLLVFGSIAAKKKKETTEDFCCWQKYVDVGGCWDLWREFFECGFVFGNHRI